MKGKQKRQKAELSPSKKCDFKIIEKFVFSIVRFDKLNIFQFIEKVNKVIVLFCFYFSINIHIEQWHNGHCIRFRCHGIQFKLYICDTKYWYMLCCCCLTHHADIPLASHMNIVHCFIYCSHSITCYYRDTRSHANTLLPNGH